MFKFSCGWAVVVLVAFGMIAPAHAAKKTPINVGVQLWSFRDAMAKDVPGTLARIQKMGITDVEIAGLYGMSAQQFHEQLESHHLHASGMHFQWPAYSLGLDGVIKDAKTLGLDYVTLPWIPHMGKFNIKDAHAAAVKFNEWGKKLAAAGLKFTYHPHGYEFSPYEGGTLFDVIAKETNPKYVNFELDIFWAYDGGADLVKLMQNYPDRFPQMHLKDMSKAVKIPNYTGGENVDSDVALGQGQMDIAAVLAEAEKIGAKHYYIEDESHHSFEQVPESIQYVRSIGY